MQTRVAISLSASVERRTVGSMSACMDGNSLITNADSTIPSLLQYLGLLF